MADTTISSSSSSALRPIVLPQLAATSSALNILNVQLAAVKSDIEGYKNLELKLASITDEPTWNAIIPFGPLAYFPGHLVHTNDIVVPPSSLLPPTAEGTKPQSQLRSAKQAREDAVKRRQELAKHAVDLENKVNQLEEAAKKAKSVYPGLEESWAVNEKGEVVNEEGLPIFDILEELPPENETPARGTLNDKPTLKFGYATKQKGKTVVRPLQSYSTPIATIPTPALKPLLEIEDQPSQILSSETRALLDQLEEEEEEDAEKTRKEEEEKEAGTSFPPDEEEDSPSVAVLKTPLPKPSPPPPPRPPPAALISIPLPPSTKVSPPVVVAPKPSKFLSSFSSGFLSKSKPKTKFKPKMPTSPPATKDSVDENSTTTTRPESTPLREPHHHILPPPKSIYRATPPSSAPNSRSSSPRPDRKVSFDVSAEDNSDSPPKLKHKRAAILLPPPPPHHSSPSSSSSPLVASSTIPFAPSESSSTRSSEPPTKKMKKKEAFFRPIKEVVVERPVVPPTVPKPTPTTLRPRANQKLPIGLSQSSSKPALSQPALPVHTLALHKNAEPDSRAGEASIYDLDSDDDHDHGEQDESDSSGFYGNDDISDEDELDIDEKLHAREVALEYHRQRMGLGAGVGTGPLGGNGLPEKWDAWDQPDVPIEATVQGRVPGTARASRFRTGRLESVQMIIPTLLASHIKQGNQESDDENDDDGLTSAEREILRTSLAKLTAGVGTQDPPPLPAPPAAVVHQAGSRPSISQMLGTVKEREDTSRAPPVVHVVAAVPISVPSNAKASLVPPLNSTGEQALGPPPKKLSRFKARQLGLGE